MFLTNLKVSKKIMPDIVKSIASKYTNLMVQFSFYRCSVQRISNKLVLITQRQEQHALKLKDSLVKLES